MVSCESKRKDNRGFFAIIVIKIFVLITKKNNILKIKRDKANIFQNQRTNTPIIDARFITLRLHGWLVRITQNFHPSSLPSLYIVYLFQLIIILLLVFTKTTTNPKKLLSCHMVQQHITQRKRWKMWHKSSFSQEKTKETRVCKRCC